MLFNSYEFLFVFLPTALAGFISFRRIGWHREALGWLLGCSLFFFAWWNPPDLVPLFLSISGNYVAGWLLTRDTWAARRRGRRAGHVDRSIPRRHRAPGRSGGPGRALALGVRPAVGRPELPHRDAGRAALPLRALNASAREGHNQSRPGALAGDPCLPEGLNLTWDRGHELAAQDVDRCHPGSGLLLRPAKSLAAGHE